MKLILTLLFFCLQLHCTLAQSGFFEISVGPDFDSGLNSITHDSSGNFYSVGGGSFGFLRYGWLMKTDLHGNIIFQKVSSERDDNYLMHIIPAADNNFLICGYNLYCDVGPPSQGILYKVSPDGNLIWKNPINPDSDTSLYSYDNQLKEVYEMQSGKIILRADSTMYLATNTGDTIWSHLFSGGLNCIGEDMLNHQIIAVNQSTILLLDTLGQVTNQFSFPYPVYHLKLLSDSNYVIACGPYLMKLDNGFNMITQFDIAQINFSPNKLEVTDSSIWISNQTGNEFAGFDLNLQLADSFRTQASEVKANSMTVYDTLIVVAGAEESVKNYHYLKSYSTSGNTSQRAVDLGISSISFDTTYGFHFSGHPQGVLSIGFVAKVTVVNTGTETIDNFNIFSNTQITYGPCGPFEYKKSFSNVNLLPGKSTDVYLDTLGEYGIIFTVPFTYTFCAWVSSPDSAVDKDHSNDYLCDSFVITYVVGIESLESEKEISIYPNPSDFFQINVNGKINSVDLLDVQGRVLFNKTINDNRTALDMSEFHEGVYLLRLNLEKGIVVRKIMVRHF